MKNSKRVIRIISIIILAFMFLGMFNSIYAFEVTPEKVIDNNKPVESKELT